MAGHALVVGGQTAAFSAFAIAALTIVFLMLFLAAAIGTAQEHVVQSLKARTHQIKRWSGVVLILTGLWLLVLAIWAEVFAQIFAV